MDHTEQWKEGGDCLLCRRQKYCSHKCKEYQKATERELRQAMWQALKSSPKPETAAEIAENTIRKYGGDDFQL